MRSRLVALPPRGLAADRDAQLDDAQLKGTYGTPSVYLYRAQQDLARWYQQVLDNRTRSVGLKEDLIL